MTNILKAHSGDSTVQPELTECFPILFQSVEHLSWLGLFKNLSEGTLKPSPFYHKRTLRKTREECEHVQEKFLQMRYIPIQHKQSIKNYFTSYIMCLKI